jgi:saccharopine dehydrogenase-like NADP-dependent oxidoreductase
MPEIEVAVIGAGGARAQGVLEIAGRAGVIGNWLAADRHWRGSERYTCERLGMRTVELDATEEPGRLRELARDTALVVNLAGPSYAIGTAVLDACIEAGCDYLDICDDPEVTREMLARDEAAGEAGVRALVCMGGAPGLSNVLIRAGAEWLGEADEVSLSWVADVADVTEASLEQLWRLFAPVDSEGERQPVPAWEELSLSSAKFPEPFGERLVLALAHSEQVTVPNFLGVETVRSFGSIVPEDSMVVNWALARLGASGGGGASDLYRRYLATRAPTDYLGSGLVVDVWSGEEGVRFASADRSGLPESAGVPTAAGILLMLEEGPDEPGVIAPECLEPAEFFRRLGRLSRGGGSLGAYRLWGSEEGVRIGIRDLLTTRTHS